MTADPTRRRPLQRPMVAALATVIARAVEQGGERPYGDRLWLDTARARGVFALVDLSEKRWHECCERIMDDKVYVNTLCDALSAMLQAILWVGPLRSIGEVPPNLRQAGPGPWLIGAWPLEQPRTTPKTLEWPNPFSMTERELMPSMQNAVLYMAFALCKRLDRMGIEPPAIEVVG